jgi:large subunit ribosomal protein L1|tara:strand:+ start:629 stop:1423 length:795 start_codon:yes stop_codon:yes gene_type:complete
MDKTLIEKTLKQVKANSPKKNFKQSIDLIINLKGMDLKKAEQQINMFVTLHNDIGRDVSVCALVGPELEKSAKEVCNEVILAENFVKFKGKKELKQLAGKYDFFISQANIMAKVATTFGRFLGPKGKMPNPKIGSVLPPNANIRPLIEKLKKTATVATKNEPVIKCLVGKEDFDDNIVIDNILTIYNSVLQKLPGESQNIKSVMLKLTMGPAFKVGEEVKELVKEEKSKKESKEQPKKRKNQNQKKNQNQTIKKKHQKKNPKQK